VKKLTTEEQEDLLEIVSHPGLKAFVRDIENAYALMVEGITKFSVSTQSEEWALIKMKHQVDGASKLLHAIKTRMDNLKARKDS
jgi:hypothetical protein